MSVMTTELVITPHNNNLLHCITQYVGTSKGIGSQYITQYVGTSKGIGSQ